LFYYKTGKIEPIKVEILKKIFDFVGKTENIIVA